MRISTPSLSVEVFDAIVSWTERVLTHSSTTEVLIPTTVRINQPGIAISVMTLLL
jgi:hypothetical protein